MGPGGLATRRQPISNLLGLFATPDFAFPAVLFAIAVNVAEGINELFELGKVHKVASEIFGDICEGVGVGLALEQVPDFVEGLKAFAQGGGHKGEAGSLDGDFQVADLKVRGLVVCLGIVSGAGETICTAQSPFAVVAGVLGIKAGGQSGGFHSG